MYVVEWASENPQRRPATPKLPADASVALVGLGPQSTDIEKTL